MSIHTSTRFPAACASALAACVAAGAAWAGPAGSPPGSPAMHAGALVSPNASVKETLIGSYDAKGNGQTAPLPQYAYTTIATTTFKCTNSTGCSVVIESMDQIQPMGGDWAICLLVDGTSVSCQYQGVQGGPSSYVVGNARGWAGGLAQGTHTVTTQLYVEGAGAAYVYFQTDVSVFKP
jgi:hypothetical protein